MADSMKLVMTFECTDGKEHNFNWKNSLEYPDDTNVKALANVMITNGSIFKYVPSKITSAKTVITTENGIDISD